MRRRQRREPAHKADYRNIIHRPRRRGYVAAPRNPPNVWRHRAPLDPLGLFWSPRVRGAFALV